MARFEDTITIHAPVEKVFAFVKDVGKLWACFPDVAVRDVVLTPEGVGSHAEWYVRMFFLHHQGRVEITEAVPDKLVGVKSSAGPVFTFTLTPQDDGETEFGSVVEWSTGVPIVGRPIDDIMARI
ncbi:MAG: SRPBCC family protein, partial [Actinomycetota bacterium]